MEKTPEQIALEEQQAAEAAAAAAAAEEAAKANQRTVKVRVLTQCEFGACNDVVRIPAARLKDAKEAGIVDDNKAAVTYAESLAQAQSDTQA